MYELFSKLVITILTLSLLQACSITQKSVYPRSINQSIPIQLDLSESEIRQKLEDGYRQWHGTPYGYGRQQLKVAVDCSGFTQQVFRQQLSINLPRTTQAQINSGQKVRLKNAKPGDLVFFDLSNGYGHVGIYLGDRIVMQATSSQGITKTDLGKQKWWANKVHSVKRVIKTKLL